MPASRPTSSLPKLSCVHFLDEYRLEHGGVVQAVQDLCHGLADRGHEVKILTCDATDAPSHWKNGQADVPRVIPMGRSSIPGGFLSRDALREFQSVAAGSQLVHLHTPWAVGDLQLARRLRAAGVPYVVSVHGMLDDWSMAQKKTKKRTFLALGGRRFLEGAARVHFTAEDERAQALRWMPNAASTASVVPLLVDLSAFDNLPGPKPAQDAYPFLRSDVPTILFLSRLHHKKGVEALISAAELLRNQGTPFQLLVAGPGEPAYVSSLRALVTEARLDEQVHFLGMVRGIEKLSLYQVATVFVLPTFQENFGLVLVEALASGTPVVTTRGTDIWRELEQGGALITERTPAAVAEAIERILDDSDPENARGEQGRAYVRRWLARDHVVGQYEQLYRDAIDKG